ncbi:MAG: class I SAM-dependent methyltransferase [Pseudorhizobium sp.]
MAKFEGPLAGYIEGAKRNVPGIDGLHRMTGLLLAERVPANARVLVVGAGGGLELKALAQQHPGWSFDGVDPSLDMLALAGKTTAAHAHRIALHHGTIGAAPDGPFDGAVCLLVFHHISREQRASTLRGIRKRLLSRSPFVLAHVSFPQDEPDRSLWIDRHIRFGAIAEMDAEKQEVARLGMRHRLFTRSPEDDEACLQEAGFTEHTQFYHALGFRGWIAYA